MRLRSLLVLGMAVVFVAACSSQQVITTSEEDLAAENLAAWDNNIEETLESSAVGTTYYVSGTGTDSNDGKSTGKAFRTLQKAHDLTNPGDIVWIMNGTYTSTGDNVLSIFRLGEPGKWIRYKAYPGHTPKLKSSKNWHGITLVVFPIF